MLILLIGWSGIKDFYPCYDILFMLFLLLFPFPIEFSPLKATLIMEETHILVLFQL